MVAFTILAGGYGAVIASYLFDPTASTLTTLKQSPAGSNPSWIARHPVNKTVLYASNEIDGPGKLLSLVIGDQGSVSQVHSVTSGGNGPAFQAPMNNGTVVAVMNYSGGNGKILPVGSDPSVLVKGSPTITFNAIVSHPHMALQYRSEIFVPDLGADKVWRLSQTGSLWSVKGYIPQPTGSGPRHAVISGSILYTLHELTSTITSQRIPNAPSTTAVSLIANVSMTPSDAPQGAVFGAAEILLPKPNSAFPQSFVYASNRNRGTADPRGDTIAIFQTDTTTGSLTLVNQVYTGLSQIRAMKFGGPDNRYLIAGGHTGGGVAVLERIAGGANLKIVARNTDVPARTSFVWL